MSKRKTNSSDAASEKPLDEPIEGRSAEDALTESEAGEAIATLEKAQSKVLYLAIAIVVGLCAILVFKQISKANKIAAAGDYSSAASAGTVEALDEVISSHSGDLAGGNALLSKVDLLQKQGKAQDAKAALERFTAEYKSHPRYPQGFLALGNLNHLAGDAEAAKAAYEKVIDVQKDGDLTPLARIRLGDLAVAAGDKELAEQHYNESIQKHPGNPFAETALQKIELLKIGNPPVVDRPKPPAPEPEPAPPTAEEKPAAPAKGNAPKATPAPKGGDAPKGKGNASKAPGPKADAPKAGQNKGAKSAPKKAGEKKGKGNKAKAPAPKGNQPKAPAPKADPAPKAPAPKADAPKAAEKGE